MQKPILETDYYLTNFFKILDFVDELYPHILNETELAFSKTFRSLPEDAKRLWVRLYSRKGPHFRPEKLNYQEIGDLNSAINALIEVGFLSKNQPQHLTTALPLLSKAELVSVLSDFVPKAASYRKSELLELLVAHASQVNQTLDFQWITLEGYLKTYQLLFFGNTHQDLTEFVLLDLGILAYENYEIRSEDRLFQSRAYLEETILLSELRDFTHLALDHSDRDLIELIELPPIPEDPVLARKHAKICNRLGSWFERQKDWERALQYYRQSQLPPSRERQARILLKTERANEALEVVHQILNQPVTQIEQDFAASFLPKVHKALNLPDKKVKRRTHPQYQCQLERTSDPIELQVLAYYQTQGIEGFYAENHFWLTVFGLAFWDIIFMPVRGAFFNRYQRGPKDMFSAEFFTNRKAAIVQRLSEIETDTQWKASCLACFQNKTGIANYFVNWQWEQDFLKDALTRIPSRIFFHIFSRIIKDPGEFRNGFPDLILYRNGIELLEVKGPGDQLQPNQRRWLNYFADHQIPYAIQKVTWSS